jgi:hypothetical protein
MISMAALSNVHAVKFTVATAFFRDHQWRSQWDVAVPCAPGCSTLHRDLWS